MAIETDNVIANLRYDTSVKLVLLSNNLLANIFVFKQTIWLHIYIYIYIYTQKKNDLALNNPPGLICH